MYREYLFKEPCGSRGVDFEKELNEEQRGVVFSKGGPCLVIAGAGSGKTRTLIYRVAKLVQDGVPPTGILLVTFTNKAAREMLSRVESLLSLDGTDVWGGTFHHIANLILRRHIGLLGFKNNYTILDEEDRADLVSMAITEFGLNENKRFPKAATVSTVLSLAANLSVGIDRIIADRFPYMAELIDDFMLIDEQIAGRKLKLNALDFDDLLVLLKRLLVEHEDVRAHYSRLFRHILVDEYQDTSKLQADVVDIVAGGHRNIMVVGDDAQSIYAFRGAHYENILGFTNRYPDAVVYKLQTNYRSTQSILDLANASIMRNKKQYLKQLAATRGTGDLPRIVRCASTEEQASFIAKHILAEDVDLNEIAVLYRSHYHSMEIQMELTRLGIPYEVRSGVRFFEQAHIKDILSFLRFVNNTRDELAFKRALKLYPGIGMKTSASLWEAFAKKDYSIPFLGTDGAAQGLSSRARKTFRDFYNLVSLLSDTGADTGGKLPSDMLLTILKSEYEEYMRFAYANFESRLDDIRQLINYSTRFKTTTEFLSEMALVATVVSPGAEEREKEHVVLSSIHQAKGLEWKVVFIPWLVDGKFPVIRNGRNDGSDGISETESDAIEEERRLFYVAATRAKDRLYLSYQEWLPDKGSHNTAIIKPSRFLRELPSYAYETQE
ncbi:MAG: ATP-dependent helicase [Deltaproteobacteria bacterium]|nr:ATP-dependent helicase [Deltaproteobacteria bacterium]MCL5277339.1 ATP-dependent helicase [Deltaproteobacteria bacterium]